MKTGNSCGRIQINRRILGVIYTEDRTLPTLKTYVNDNTQTSIIGRNRTTV